MTMFTIALNVLNTDYHLSLIFMEPIRTKKAQTSPLTGSGTIFDVVYWEHCDLTVALVNSDFVQQRFQYWQSLGYSYNLQFKPHFTIGKGDLTQEYKHLIHKEISLGEEYFRLY